MANNLTQEELAERAGVSARLISDLERGVVQRSRRDTVEMLADGLELEATERATFAALSRRRQVVAAEQQAVAPPSVKLPLQPTSFIGREREVSATTSLLLQPETRLVTLTGPGGVGKTRLAIETARRSASAFPDGVVFVDLSAVSAPDQVVPAIATALELQANSGAAALDELAQGLQDKGMLLVLDNLEHLIAVGPDISTLVDRCPHLNVLATSRQILQLRAEREYPVAPLGLPDSGNGMSIDTLSETPAIQLFVSRAESAQPSFALTEENAEVVAGIVTQLDGLPLAIELAAARMRLLAPHELFQRLNRSLSLLTGGPRDVPDRQRTLRGAIEWSYQLLAPEEQRVFSWLAVFNGGFSLDAAEYLVEQMDGSAPVSALDALASLVDKSLIQRRRRSDVESGPLATRFRMLETIREYGLEQLAQLDERDEVRDHHAVWCVEIASQSDEGLNGPQQSEWLARLRAEHENFRAALDWTIELGQSEQALLLSGSLLRFWVSVGQFAEARRWYEQALDLDPEAEAAPRAKALLGIEVISYFQGDYAAAKAYGEEGLRIYQTLDDADGIAKSYGNLGLVADAEEDYDRATEFYERALTIFQEIGDRTHTHFMLGNLGLIAHLQGDQERAAKRIEASLAISREMENHTSIAINLGNLGLVTFARGDLDKALAYQVEALELRTSLDDDPRLGRSFDDIAIIATARGDYERAARLFAAAEMVRTVLGTSSPPSDREFRQSYIENTQRALGQDRFLACWEEGAALSTDDAVRFALDASPRTHT